MGFLTNWKDKRRLRLEKIKDIKQKPEAPLLEELKEKPGLKEVRMRKLVERSDTNFAKEASKDDYI